MTAPTLTLETAEERELWLGAYVAAAHETDRAWEDCAEVADAAVRAYRERRAPPLPGHLAYAPADDAPEPGTIAEAIDMCDKMVALAEGLHSPRQLERLERDAYMRADAARHIRDILRRCAPGASEPATRCTCILDSLNRACPVHGEVSPPAEEPPSLADEMREIASQPVDWHHEWSRECERFNTLARAILPEGWDDYLTPGEVVDLCLCRLAGDPCEEPDTPGLEAIADTMDATVGAPAGGAPTGPGWWWGRHLDSGPDAPMRPRCVSEVNLAHLGPTLVVLMGGALTQHHLRDFEWGGPCLQGSADDTSDAFIAAVREALEDAGHDPGTAPDDVVAAVASVARRASAMAVRLDELTRAVEAIEGEVFAAADAGEFTDGARWQARLRAALDAAKGASGVASKPLLASK